MEASKNVNEKNFLLETCVLAGKIMLENGGEMSRVEDTMNVIAANYHQEEGVSFVTPTVVLMGLESTKSVQMKRISERTINLEKVAQVNDLSWQFKNKNITLTTLNTQLVKINSSVPQDNRHLKIISAAFLSASLMILLGGKWSEFIATLLVGAGGYSAYMLSVAYLKIKYLNEFVAALTIGLLAFLMINLGVGNSVEDMIVGSIMPLVPGVAITNAVRDLQEGHMLAGLSRGVEALIIASMIGAGIALAFNMTS